MRLTEKGFRHIAFMSILISLVTVLILMAYTTPTGVEMLLQLILLVSIALNLFANPVMRVR